MSGPDIVKAALEELQKPLKPSEVFRWCEEKYGTCPVEAVTIREAMPRMAEAGELEKIGYGVYDLPRKNDNQIHEENGPYRLKPVDAHEGPRKEPWTERGDVPQQGQGQKEPPKPGRRTIRLYFLGREVGRATLEFFEGEDDAEMGSSSEEP